MAELVLVTGGSGYVAGWCIAELLRRGYEVRTTVRDPGREQGVADAVSSVTDPGPAELRRGRPDRRRRLGRRGQGVDYVLHVASPARRRHAGRHDHGGTRRHAAG